MRNKRFFFFMCGVFVLIVILIGTFVFFGIKTLGKESKKLQEARTAMATADQQKVAQTKAKKDLAKYSELNEITRSIVPQDKDQAKTVRELNAIARSSGIRLKTITFATSTLGQAPAKTSGSSESGASTTPSAPATPSITQVKPVDGITGVYSLEITIANDSSTSVTYDQLIRFLSGLEANRRTAHVQKITLTPGGDGKIVFNITLNAYLKP